MTILAWPVNAVAGAPAYSGRDARQAQSVYLAGATTADPFGARSGVRPGTSPTTVTVAAGAWTIGAHAGVLDLQAAIEAAPYLYKVDAVGGLPTGAVTPAHATLARTDIVWLRIDDPAEVDGSTVPAVVAGYTAGTTGGLGLGGGNPATPARSMVLAWVNVPASGGGAPTVTWKAPHAVSAGVAIPVNSLGERDAMAGYLGLQVKRLDVAGSPIETYSDGTWSGGPWASYTPTLPGIALGNGTVVAAFQRVGKSLDLSVHVTFGTTTSWGTGDIGIGLPPGMVAARPQVISAWLNDSSTGFDYLAAGRIAASVINLALNATFIASVNASRPFAWATGDQIIVSGRLEIT